MKLLKLTSQFGGMHIVQKCRYVSASPRILCLKCIQDTTKPQLLSSLQCKTEPQKFPSIMIQGSWSRGYAKGKDKKKEHKGHKNIQIDEQQLSEVIKLDAFKSSLERAIQNLKDDYIKNVSLRSATGSIESLEIAFDGSEYSLQELAEVVRKDPKTVIVNMSVFPQAIPDVLNALNKSGLNLNPQQDGTTIFIPIPKVTKEHRESLAKNAKALFIKCRDSIKDIQNKTIRSVKNNTKISEDLCHSVQEQVTAIADNYISAANKIYESKTTELLG